ncbi:MAG: beta strand repeat-containing protein [Planctomycetota bacterium]
MHMIALRRRVTVAWRRMMAAWFVLMLTAVVFGPATTVVADWTDSFPNGSPQQFWMTDASPGVLLTSATFFSTGTASGGITLQGFALAGPNVAYGLVPTESFVGTGVVVRSVVNPTSVALAGPQAGVVAQVDTGAGTGYMATIEVSATGAQSTLRIAELSSGVTVSGSARLLTFSQTNSYVVELETLGPLLLARAYDPSSMAIVSQASTFDSTPAVQGFAGVGVWTTSTTGTSIGGKWGTTSAATPLPSLVWTPGGTIPSGSFATGTWSGAWTTGSSNWFATTGTATRWDPGRVAVFGGQTVTGTTAGGTVTVSGSAGVGVSVGMRFTVDGYRVLSGSQAPITLSGTATPFIDVVQGSRATIAAPLAGSAGFRKTGAGALVLSGSNFYTGPTMIAGGTVVLGTNASIASSPLIRVDSGAVIDLTQKVGGYLVPEGQTLAGTGTVAAATLGVGSGATLSPGSSPGTLTLSGSVTFGSGGNYNWQMLSGTGSAGAPSTWDLVSIIGPLSIAATSADPFRINLWTLSGTGPDVSGTAANFVSGSNYTWKIATATGGISGFAANKFLINTSGTNGTDGFANPYGSGTFSVAQSGSDLNLVFTAGPSLITINVASGTQTQTQAGYPTLSGSIPVLKSGGGTLVLDKANTLSGSTTVQGGVVRLASAAALASSNLVVVAGGTAQVSPYVVAGVAGLNLSGTGLVDVTNGGMTVASGLSASTLVAKLIAGRNGGTWDGTNGITSSVTAAEVANFETRAVGWLDNGDGSMTVAYAAQGDTNLDWVIDILDVSNFVSSGRFGTGQPATWADGDFNYDGVVDIQDVADFSATGLYGKASYNAAPSVAAVPEPTCVGLVIAGGLVALPLLRRKRPGW